MTDIDFDPVDHITVGAVGPPGERTFMLQARSGSETATLIIEKDQAVRLGEISEEVMDRLGQSVEPPEISSMQIDPTRDPLWRVGEISLGYEESRGLIVLECKEIAPEDADGASARFVITPDQLGALGLHSMAVAALGRPACPICGRPMDATGHVCPDWKWNGHRTIEA